MVVNADQFVANANKAHSNDPGTCLMTVRQWAGIAAVYPDAATAWRNVKDKHTDRNPPKGSAVYWTGGSHGYGHIVCSLGGQRIRSTDCTYAGQVSTADLGWVERAWGLPYAGWAWEINGVTIPHGEGEDDVLNSDDKEWIKQQIANSQKAVIDRVNALVGDVVKYPTKEDDENTVMAKTALSMLLDRTD